jgi:4-amino-4-deoxy-L-arabinose transferase-like glycosyltransferase
MPCPTSTRARVGAIVLVAFVLRLGCAIALGNDVRTHFIFDPSVYDLLARRLVEGRGYVGYLAQPTAYFPPGYPAVLAGAYLVFGDDLRVAWTLNAVCGALTCLFTYLIGVRLFTPRIGLLAAALLAVFPGDVLRSSLTLTEPLFGCLVTVATYLFVRWRTAAARRGRWLAFGAVLGAAGLVRAVALVFPFVFAVVWAIRDGVRTALARTGAVVAGISLVLLPWMARNAALTGVWIISTDGTYAFFNTHNPMANGTQSVDMHELRVREWPWIARLPLEQQEVAMSREELRYGFRYALGHPREELAAILPRLGYLYGSDHHPLSADSPSAARHAVLRIADLFFFAMLLLAAIGLPDALRPPPERLVLPAIVLAITALHAVLFFGEPRYHAPVVPALALLAACGLWRAGRLLTRLV